MYFQIIKLECQVTKNEHFDTFFAFNQGSNFAKAADLYSGDSYQQGIKNLLNIGKTL